MFLSDPALRLIAARTGDVWPDHLWRYDTAPAEPFSELARHLHRITLEFNDATELLFALLDRLDGRITCIRHDLRLRSTAHQYPGDTVRMELAVLLERHTVLADTLADAYQGWRAHHVPDPDPAVRHLLASHRDPSGGVFTLARPEPGRWHVIPDAQAAKAGNIPYANTLVGEVIAVCDGWRPVAYTTPGTPQSLRYQLPVTADLATACRMLMRWWNLRHSVDWRSRTPDQLTETELAWLAE
jgi:hypothetical protein